jgi:flagellar protein FlgJ
MIPNADLSTRFALDVASVESLKREARSDPDKALRSAAAQFEALLMQMMLKSMREASDVGGNVDSSDTKLYKSMLDQQLSIAMAKRGVGLADIMVRQLSRAGASASADDAALPGSLPSIIDPAGAVTAPARAPTPANAVALPPVDSTVAPNTTGLPEQARAFVQRHWPHALEASRTLGVAPHFILGQAALESGWGRSEIRNADGTTSHNLFGIKAGRGWQGATSDVVTTEYVNGVPVKMVDKFRAYGSYAEAFRDYANLIAVNPRYTAVMNERNDPMQFARALQQAGYATDPNYADKLTRVITGTVMRTGLGG